MGKNQVNFFEKEANRAVALRDYARLKTLFDDDEKLRAYFLTLLGQLDPWDPTDRDLVVSFSEQLLQSKEFLPIIAEAAFLAQNSALFDRAVVALGDNIKYLSPFVYKLLERGEFDGAVAILRLLCNKPEATINSWNNMAYALFHARTLPEDTSHLLQKAEAHGVAHPYIFHNTACAWLRLGERDKALSAVENSVRVGYHLLEKMQHDEDLASLQTDPRFVAAFQSPPVPLLLEELVVYFQYQNKTYPVAQPVLMYQFFLEDVSTNQAAPAIANLLETYLADIPRSAIGSYREHIISYPLHKEKIKADIGKLRWANDQSHVSIRYRSTTDWEGNPTPYGIEGELPSCYGVNIQFYREKSSASIVQIWFPADVHAGNVEHIVDRFIRYVKLLPCEAATCGLFQLLRSSVAKQTFWDKESVQIHADRFLGFSRSPEREHHKGKAPAAAWLTFLNANLVNQLGGPAALSSAAQPAQAIPAPEGGLCLRASLAPGIGVPPHPTDLGALPSIARALKPLRVPDEAYYDRWDHLENAPWNNRFPT